MNEIWNEILKQLSGKLNRTAFDTWFAGCEFTALEKDLLVISAGSAFKKAILEQRFSDLIKETAEDLLCSKIDVLILNDAEEAQEYLARKSFGSDEILPGMDEFTFDRFVVGPSNEFVYNIARTVASLPDGRTYNPFFIYSASGMGKTHLLCAAGQEIKKKFPGKKIIFVKANDFLNKFIAAIRNHATDDFRDEYRDADVLLIDDVYILAGKRAMQEEFFNVFNTLYEAGRQIILTSDKPPREMEELEERLRSRFEGGIIAEIQKPDPEHRRAILRSKAAEFNVSLSEENISYIADSLTDNVRQLEGAVKNIAAYYAITGKISEENIRLSVGNIGRKSGNRLSAGDILRETARYFSVKENEITGESREKRISSARQTAMYLMSRHLDITLAEIGSFFKRDHSTVLSSIKKIDRLRSESNISDAINTIEMNLKND